MSLRICRCFLLLNVLVILGVSALAIVGWFNLGRFLDVTTPSTQADAIVVLGGEGGRFMRTRHAVELYAQGLAPVVVFSGGTLASTGIVCTSTALSVEAAMQLGLPEEAVLSAPEAQSTLEEAANLNRLATEQEWTTLLIVTDRFHTRRALRTLETYLPGIKIQAGAPDDPEYRPDRWWATERSLVFAVNELLKLSFYWIQYGIRPIG